MKELNSQKVQNKLRNKFLKYFQPDISKYGGISLVHKYLNSKYRKKIFLHFLGSGVGLITSAHLLDRLLWNQYYMVPNWYINTHRVAYYDKFLQPITSPLYYQATNYVLQTWSMK